MYTCFLIAPFLFCFTWLSLLLWAGRAPVTHTLVTHLTFIVKSSISNLQLKLESPFLGNQPSRLTAAAVFFLGALAPPRWNDSFSFLYTPPNQASTSFDSFIKHDLLLPASHVPTDSLSCLQKPPWSSPPPTCILHWVGRLLPFEVKRCQVFSSGNWHFIRCWWEFKMVHNMIQGK